MKRFWLLAHKNWRSIRQQYVNTSSEELFFHRINKFGHIKLVLFHVDRPLILSSKNIQVLEKSIWGWLILKYDGKMFLR
jgi:hypothetical protein